MEKEINGKVQKINDEDYEIIKVIESKGMVMAAQWYSENYDSNLSDAKDVIRSISKKYGVKRKGQYIPDEEEMVAYIEQLRDEYARTGVKADLNDAKKWYMEVSGCDETEAIYALGNAFKKYNELHGYKNIYGLPDPGCFGIILIAIVFTFSVFSLL